MMIALSLLLFASLALSGATLYDLGKLRWDLFASGQIVLSDRQWTAFTRMRTLALVSIAGSALLNFCALLFLVLLIVGGR